MKKKISQLKFIGIIFSFILVIIGTVYLLGLLEDPIISNAKKTYSFREFLQHDAIKLKINNEGVVMLTGTVANESHRTLAFETVAMIPGVNGVDNRLMPKIVEPATNSDLDIAAKVNLLLKFQKNVELAENGVDVTESIVTIKGTIKSIPQSDLIYKYLNKGSGILGINNELIIEKTGINVAMIENNPIDDASLSAQVNITLQFNASSGADEIVGRSKDGVITLNGVVKDRDEMELISEMISNINGVKSVKNHITIG